MPLLVVVVGTKDGVVGDAAVAVVEIRVIIVAATVR